jgi:TPR repeat protein
MLVAVLLVTGLASGLWMLGPSLAERLQGAGQAAPDEAAQSQARLAHAARDGNHEAQYRLAKRLLHDRSRGQEGTREGVLWLKKAAEGGHAGAMLHLGKLHRTGVGVLQNFEQARHWLQRAASAGNAEAMMELGRLYRSGSGVRQDLKQAYVWFNRAAAALHAEAHIEREGLALRLSAAELKEAQERSALQPAAQVTAASAAGNSDVMPR